MGETRMYRTHLTLAPEVTLPDVAPVEARALEATLVLSTLILLPVRGERLERSFARLALALRQTVRLLRLPRRAFLLRDPIRAARLFELRVIVHTSDDVGAELKGVRSRRS